MSAPQPPRWNHLFQLWDRVFELESLPQFDRWVSEEFKRNPKYGSRDRRWYSEVLFAGVRFAYLSLFLEDAWRHHRKNYLEHISNLNKNVPQPGDFFKKLSTVEPESFFFWSLMRLKLEAGWDEEIPNSEGNAKEEFFHKVYGALKESNEVAAKMVAAAIPLWFAPHLASRIARSGWNEATVAAFLNAQSKRPPLWIRLNHPESSKPFFTELENEGFKLERQGDAVAVMGLKGIFSTDAYRNGLFEIQDFASQQIGNALGSKPGELVWDSCAGGGGKTLQIAAHLANKGAVYASDVRAYKLDEVRKRARRAGFHNVRCIPWDGDALPTFPREVHVRGGFDRVLVDAPCTSTGTWRRNPDAKYRVDQTNVENLQELQLRILEKACRALKPKGTLVYSTCSFTVEENEIIAERFLERNKNFKLVSQNLLGCPDLDADTMFAAVMQRD